MRKPQILLVEDDPSLSMALEDALDREGYCVELVQDGKLALARGMAKRFDLIVLDLMLPGMDGYEICRRLREGGRDVPVLMLTARGREEDRVRGLDLGADDYVVKPFSLRELLARVRARLRAAKPHAPAHVTLDGIEIDVAGMRVLRDGEAHTLTKLEAGVLAMFLANPNEVLTRARFLDEVWGYDRHPTTRTVDMHVARVREKLGDAGAEPKWIHTVHGVGYRFDAPEGFTTP